MNRLSLSLRSLIWSGIVSYSIVEPKGARHFKPGNAARGGDRAQDYFGFRDFHVRPREAQVRCIHNRSSLGQHPDQSARQRCLGGAGAGRCAEVLPLQGLLMVSVFLMPRLQAFNFQPPSPPNYAPPVQAADSSILSS